MKNKRGFTLTEILITIAIIGIIILIAVPSISSISNAIKQQSLQSKKEVILQAAELYAKDRESVFENLSEIGITVDTLIEAGYITVDISECEHTSGCVTSPVDNTYLNDESIIIKRRVGVTQAVYGELVDANIFFEPNGADAIGMKSAICTVQNGICTLKIIPSITRNGGTVYGWGYNKDYNSDDTFLSAENEDGKEYYLAISDSLTLYAQTSEKLEVTFELNGATSISTPDGSCTLYNEQSSCSITSPTITRENGTTIGWNANKDATISEWSVGATKNISVDTTYYAITSKDITASFYYKGTKQDNLTTTKTIYNTDTVTNVEMPSSLPYVRGWSISENGTEPIYLGGAFVPITEDTKFYSVIQDKTLTAYFYINGADRITDKNNASNTCNSPGCVISVSCETTGDSCEINLPRIERNDGVNSSGAQYTAGEIGWFNASNIYDPTSTLFFEGEAESEKEITNGEEYYASSYIQGSITFTDEEKSETQELKIHNSNTAVVTVTPEIGSKPDYIALGWNINGQYIQGEKYLTIYKKDYGSTYHAEYKDNRKYVCQKQATSNYEFPTSTDAINQCNDNMTSFGLYAGATNTCGAQSGIVSVPDGGTYTLEFTIRLIGAAIGDFKDFEKCTVSVKRNGSYAIYNFETAEHEEWLLRKILENSTKSYNGGTGEISRSCSDPSARIYLTSSIYTGKTIFVGIDKQKYCENGEQNGCLAYYDYELGGYEYFSGSSPIRSFSGSYQDKTMYSYIFTSQIDNVLESNVAAVRAYGYTCSIQN